MAKNIFVSNDSNQLYDSIKRKLLGHSFHSAIYGECAEKLSDLRLLSLERPTCKISWCLGL